MGWPQFFALAVGLSVLACGGREEETFGTMPPGITTPVTDDDTSEGGSQTSDSDTGPEVFDVGNGGGSTGPNTGGGDGECGCSNVQDGIYVLNSNTPPAVHFFDPPANTFTQIGVLGCDPGAGWTANSMAVDRQGYAWVNYYYQSTETGKMFKAPLYDLAQCEELPYQQPAGGWWLLGMGYAVTDPNSSCDELFIFKSDLYIEYPNFTSQESELARYDQGTNALDIIGPTMYPVGELTGTGDGRLFTFAAVGNNEAVLVNLDKETGSEIEHSALDLDITNAFAFAFWGGDVYFFTETSPLSGESKVTKLDYDGNEGGALTTYNANTGIHIPGAGVSTCASITPPG